MLTKDVTAGACSTFSALPGMRMCVLRTLPASGAPTLGHCVMADGLNKCAREV
jgi:hypothetical protein